MDQQRINFIVKDEDGKQITFRTGEAMPIKVPKRETLSGVISTPADWLEQKVNAKANFLDFSEMSAVVDMDNSQITLTTNDREVEHGGTTVVGTLTLNTVLDSLKINDESYRYTAKALHKKLRFLRHIFADASEYDYVLKSLISFKGQVSEKLDEMDDQRGNKFSQFERQLESEFDCKFMLECPVFKGFEVRKFSVEVRFDIDGKEVKFWLESIPLAELIEDSKATIVEDVEERLRDLLVTVTHR